MDSNILIKLTGTQPSAVTIGDSNSFSKFLDFNGPCIAQANLSHLQHQIWIWKSSVVEILNIDKMYVFYKQWSTRFFVIYSECRMHAL